MTQSSLKILKIARKTILGNFQDTPLLVKSFLCYFFSKKERNQFFCRAAAVAAQNSSRTSPSPSRGIAWMVTTKSYSRPQTYPSEAALIVRTSPSPSRGIAWMVTIKSYSRPQTYPSEAALIAKVPFGVPGSSCNFSTAPRRSPHKTTGVVRKIHKTLCACPIQTITTAYKKQFH